MPENGVEAANFLQCPFVEGHVAAWEVLRLAIGQHYVRRPPGGSHHRRRHRGILRREQVRPSDTRKLAADQAAHQVIQPVLVGPAVRIRKGDNLAGRHRDAGVPRHGEPQVRLVADITHLWEKPGDFPRRVGGSVVDQDDFVVRVVEPQ